MTDNGSGTASVACKPLLEPSKQHHAKGYIVLHNQEAKYTRIALDHLSEPIELWYRYLSLFDEALRGDHESPETVGSQEHDAWELRMRLIATELSTAKLALDAMLAGYYAQALGLIRRMLESWRLMILARVRPDMAKQWLQPNHKGEYETPNDGKIIREIGKGVSKKDKTLHSTVMTVNRLIVRCHKGAHPSEYGFITMETRNNVHRHIGATFIESRLLETLSIGLISLGLFLDELKTEITVSNKWASELKTTNEFVSQWSSQHQ